MAHGEGKSTAFGSGGGDEDSEGEPRTVGRDAASDGVRLPGADPGVVVGPVREERGEDEPLEHRRQQARGSGEDGGGDRTLERRRQEGSGTRREGGCAARLLAGGARQ